MASAKEFCSGPTWSVLHQVYLGLISSGEEGAALESYGSNWASGRLSPQVVSCHLPTPTFPF